MKLLAISTLAVATALSEQCDNVLKTVSASPENHQALCDSDEVLREFAQCFVVDVNQFEADIKELCQPIDRSITSTILQSALVRNLREYGCWCNTASDWQVGRGEPVDGLDTACRNVHHSYKCLAAEGCSKDLPWVTAPEFVDGKLKWTCTINGNGKTFPDPVEADCAVKACTIGTHLIASIQNLYLGGDSITPAHVHIGTDFEQMDFMGNVVGTVPGEFDFDAECVAIPGIRDKKCCGPYPYRREYDVNSAECCVESGYEKIRSCGQCFVDDLSYPSEC